MELREKPSDREGVLREKQRKSKRGKERGREGRKEGIHSLSKINQQSKIQIPVRKVNAKKDNNKKINNEIISFPVKCNQII